MNRKNRNQGIWYGIAALLAVLIVLLAACSTEDDPITPGGGDEAALPAEYWGKTSMGSDPQVIGNQLKVSTDGTYVEYTSSRWGTDVWERFYFTGQTRSNAPYDAAATVYIFYPRGEFIITPSDNGGFGGWGFEIGTGGWHAWND